MKAIFIFLGLSCVSMLAAFNSTIPVLHLPDYYDETKREDFLNQLEEASRDVGFFALTGTGIDVELLDNAYDSMVTFFSQDFDEKLKLQSTNGQRGYIPEEVAKGETRIDFKDYYHIGRELPDSELNRLGMEKNVWPENLPEYKKSMIDLYSAMDECKNAIGDAYTDVLQKEKGFINKMTEEGQCLMRAIHYPANPPANEIWAGAHTDIDLFTILPRSTARGLQVLNTDGEWMDVIVPDNAFVINCADMLENLTNGYFRSSIHRVVDPGEKKERYSVVFFVHPRSEERLDPLPHFIEKTGGIRKYANVTRLELLAERLIDTEVASYELMEFFVNSGAIDRLREVDRFSPDAEKTLRKFGFQF